MNEEIVTHYFVYDSFEQENSKQGGMLVLVDFVTLTRAMRQVS